MKLGFVSAILPDAERREVLAFASANRLSCVELMCWPRGKAERRYAGVTHLDVTTLTPARASELRDELTTQGVDVSALGYYPNPLASDPAESAAAVEHLRCVIDAASLLGVNLVTTFVGRDPRLRVEDNWPRFLATWRPLVAHAEDRGVRIAIENCPMLFTGDEWPGGKNLAFSPRIWSRMFEDISSPNFGLNYDPSHLVWQQIDYLQPVRTFASRILHVHAKDCRVDKQRLNEVGILASPLEYHVPKLPGLGEVDWGRFLSVLGEIGYRGPVCIEVEDRAYEGTRQRREAALLQSARYLRRFLPSPG